MRITTVSPDGKNGVKNGIACGTGRESEEEMRMSGRHEEKRERWWLTVNLGNPLGFSDADAEQKRQRL